MRDSEVSDSGWVIVGEEYWGEDNGTGILG